MDYTKESFKITKFHRNANTSVLIHGLCCENKNILYTRRLHKTYEVQKAAFIFNFLYNKEIESLDILLKQLRVLVSDFLFTTLPVTNLRLQ